MTMFVALGALLALLTLVLLTWPLWRRGGRNDLREQFDQLAALKRSGVLADAQYDDARQKLEQQVAEAGATTVTSPTASNALANAARPSE